LNLYQCLSEVFHQIIGRFDPHRQTNEPFCNPGMLPILARHPRMRRGGRPRDKRFDSAQTGCHNRQRRPSYEVIRLFSAALQLETQHTAEAFEQLARARVARVTLESGIVDTCDRGMAFEELGELERALVLKPDSQC